MSQGNGDLVGRVRGAAQTYRRGEDRPLGGYVLVMAVFAALVAGAAGLVTARGRRLPELGPQDLLLLATGTHKLSRLLAKDPVTSPIRAPFTRYSGTGGPAEVMEEVQTGSGARHAIGELITCPFCLDLWIATGFMFGFVFAPRLTRLVAGTFTALAGADFLQLAYARAQQAATGG
jgi:hypothetical protein